MPSDHSRFHQAYRQHLLAAQRQEVLRALRDTLDPETTLGEIVDAAESLGWGEPFGDMSLAELADALVEEDEAEPEPGSLASLGGGGAVNKPPEPAAKPMPVISREAVQAELEYALGIGRNGASRPDSDDEDDEDDEDDYDDEQDDDEEEDVARKPIAKPAPRPVVHEKKVSKRLAKASSKKAAKALPVKKTSKKSAAARPAPTPPVKKVSKKASKKPSKKPAAAPTKKSSKKPAKKKSRR